MYSDTVTLFCRGHTDSGDVWYPYILHDVDLNVDRGYIMKVYGADASDNASLHMRCAGTGQSGHTIDGRSYVLPKAWDDVAPEDKSGYITLQGGTNFGFFMVGDYGSEEPVSDDDYRMGFYQYMNSQHDGVYAITSVSGPFSLIPHLEVLGK